jgi:hypothetical protein
MSRLSDVLNSGRVPDVFEQVVRFRLFGISASFSRHTGFRFFVGSHGFSCFLRFTRLSVFSCLPVDTRKFVFFGTHGTPYHRVFRGFVFLASHGFPYYTAYRVSVFLPFHESLTASLSCGPSDDPVHALLFAPCVTSTLLVGICPSQPSCCRGAGASSASLPSAWALADSASLNHTCVHWRSPNDCLFQSRQRHPIDFRSRRPSPIQALPHPALPSSSALRRGLSALAALAPFSLLGRFGRFSPSSSARRGGVTLAHLKTTVTCLDQEAW